MSQHYLISMDREVILMFEKRVFKLSVDMKTPKYNGF